MATSLVKQLTTQSTLRNHSLQNSKDLAASIQLLINKLEKELGDHSEVAVEFIVGNTVDDLDAPLALQNDHFEPPVASTAQQGVLLQGSHPYPILKATDAEELLMNPDYEKISFTNLYLILVPKWVVTNIYASLQSYLMEADAFLAANPETNLDTANFPTTIQFLTSATTLIFGNEHIKGKNFSSKGRTTGKEKFDEFDGQLLIRALGHFSINYRHDEEPMNDTLLPLFREPRIRKALNRVFEKSFKGTVFKCPITLVVL